MELLDKAKAALFKPVSILSLVVFRIAFGCILLWEVARYFEKDWIRTYWMKPEFNFPYGWFEWVKPWEGDGMIYHFYLLGILAVLIILGLFYRVASVLMFFAFTYMFLLEQARYLNHFYLVSLVTFLMMFVPANRNYSLDALLWKKIKTDFVPAWSVFLIAFQIGAGYFFGGVAKINYDWLILAEPMQHWLYDQQDYPLIGRFFDEPWMAYFMSWSGMFLDLLAPFLLLFRRTRPFMFAAILSFHFMNDRLFMIGIFPWFMVLASTVLFPPDWVKNFLTTIKNNYRNQGAFILGGGIVFSLIGIYFHRGFELLPFIFAALGGAILIWLFIDFFVGQPAPLKLKPKAKQVQAQPLPVYKYNGVIVALICVWALLQITVPLRHYFIPGEVSWTEEGHRFSWHMKLRGKSGRIAFYAYHPATGRRQEIDVKRHLKSWQFSKMRSRPYMIQQFAEYLDKKLEKEGKGSYEVRVVSYCRLNYRPYALMIDSTVDLSKQTYSDFVHNDWILHLDESLKPASVHDEQGGRDEDD